MRRKGMITLISNPHRGSTENQVSLYWRRKPREKGKRRS
jgi:hypothetical protein